MDTATTTRDEQLARRAHELIPAGCHTYSKGDDQFPANAPHFLVRGKGCYTYDMDGAEYLDWGMGLRSVILGHCYPRVLEAVTAQLQLGSNFTRPAPIEVELAELLVATIPSAQMVKFAKNGSDVTSAAIRLARAYTGRDLVAVCKDHPFFSFNDWFIGSTACNAGVPQAVQDLTLTFNYNDLASLEALFARHPGQIATVILEPVATIAPAPGFLEGVQRLAHEHGAVLVFDEMIAGCRWHASGAQAYFGVTPDMSTWGKGIANGFAVSALVGKREIMELGGLQHEHERVFLLSATHGGEAHALAAAIATLSEIQQRDVVAHGWHIGTLLVDGLNEAARRRGLGELVSVEGYPCSPYVVCRDQNGGASMPLRTLLLQELFARHVMMPYIAISFSHGESEVTRTIEAFDEALAVYGQALESGDALRYVRGPVVKPVFRRYN